MNDLKTEVTLMIVDAILELADKDVVTSFTISEWLDTNVHWREIEGIVAANSEPRLSQKQLLDDVRDGESTRLRDEFVEDIGERLEFHDDGSISGEFPGGVVLEPEGVILEDGSLNITGVSLVRR